MLGTLELMGRADPAPDAAGQAGLFAAAFEAAPWPALVLSAEGRLLAANDAAELLFGQSLALLSRRPLEGALLAGSPLPAMLARAREEGVLVREPRVEVALRSAVPFEVEEAAAAPLADGKVLLTFHVQAQGSRLERTAESLRSVAGMGRTLAHEIKNPLAGIRGAAQLLKSNAAEGDAELAQLIVDETDRIRRLIDQVESFSDERSPVRAPVNIHQVLDRVRALIATASGDRLTVKVNYDPSLPLALGDRDQLVQVFLNLAKNAAEAAEARPDGRGEVVISTAYWTGTRVRSGASGRGAALEVRVQDNGPGVAPELREQLFDPFISTKPQGMGLGLTLAAKLVRAHGGRIEFDSEPGRTVFHVILPVTEGALEASP